MEEIIDQDIDWLDNEEVNQGEEFSDKIYGFIERDFGQCLEYVSLDKEQLRVYSYRFGDLILRIGPEILQAFELALFNYGIAKHVSKTPELKKRILAIQRKREHRKESFIDYLKAFSCLESGKTHKVEVPDLGGFIVPFEIQKKEKRELVSWWEYGYNALKHRRTKEFSKSATLGFALFSLAGLYVLQYTLDGYLYRKAIKSVRKSSVFGNVSFQSDRLGLGDRKLSYDMERDRWVERDSKGSSS